MCQCIGYIPTCMYMCMWMNMWLDSYNSSIRNPSAQNVWVCVCTLGSFIGPSIPLTGVEQNRSKVSGVSMVMPLGLPTFFAVGGVMCTCAISVVTQVQLSSDGICTTAAILCVGG